MPRTCPMLGCRVSNLIECIDRIIANFMCILHIFVLDQIQGG